jgi:hypothetical protein
MKISLALATLALGGTALALPAAELEARQNSGSYTISGLGARKKQITAAGADSFDLAVAMLESERMQADYAYGDNKQQDSANFGIFKQNWGMLRECCSRFRGQPQSNWNNALFSSMFALFKFAPNLLPQILTHEIALTSMPMSNA